VIHVIRTMQEIDAQDAGLAGEADPGGQCPAYVAAGPGDIRLRQEAAAALGLV
jgi:hypothetical protein